MLQILALAILASPSQSSFHAEAERLTQLTIKNFFDKDDRIWKPPVASSESVGTQGYTF